jgi:hypothetical protein
MPRGMTQETDMRRTFGSAAAALALAALGAATAGAPAAGAPYAAQLYPYCALSTASGATTCYFRSRAECGTSCISNPWYVGAGNARVPAHHGRRRVPHVIRSYINP